MPPIRFSRVNKARCQLDTGHHPQHAVVLAGIAHRVQMGAQQQRRPQDCGKSEMKLDLKRLSELPNP